MTNNVVIIILYIAFIVVASCIVGSAFLTLYEILSNNCCVKTAKVVPIEEALEVSYDSERSLASVYEDFNIEEAVVIDTDSD